MNTRNVMRNIRALVKQTNFTHREIGIKMGYPPASARQSVAQFLKTENPTLAVVVRFADAMKVSLEVLMQEEKIRVR